MDELHQGVPEALVRALQRAALLLSLPSRDVAHVQVCETTIKVNFSFSFP